jgi:hypothetical protein
MPALIVRDFGGARVDTTDWPILLLEFPEHRVPDADYEAALGYIERIMVECKAKREKCAQVTDISRMKEIANARQRKYAGEWLERNTALIVEASVGGATVTPSAILRGLVTAVHWFNKPATASEFVATREEALRYVIGLLETARVPLSDRVRDLRDRLYLRDRPMRPRQSSWTNWPH